MPISVIRSRGRTTIPKAVRESLHLKPKDKLLYIVEQDRVIVLPIHGGIRGLRGIFKLPAGEQRPLDFKKLRRTFESAAAERVMKTLR